VGLATVLLGLATALVGTGLAPARGQFSPKCQLNGRQVFCAVTLDPDSSEGWRNATVVLADDTLLRLSVRASGCRAAPPDLLERCPARVTVRDGAGSRTYAGTYRLRGVEGGVTHHYLAGPVDLRFFFMD
jgi:hypothetical protein